MSSTTRSRGRQPKASGPPPPLQASPEHDPGVSVRPMRLKVLYTFDAQNETNCLARWPHVLDIQTIAMDETTSIGVVDLKTCIEAVIQCSPELVATAGQDYTVYAYDYSECDHPLVGQGMLSRTLAAPPPAPNTPVNQSSQLVTGRVCKNILGLFSNGIRETLEVKLRLVPMPIVSQNQLMNQTMLTNFDHRPSFAQTNPSPYQPMARPASSTTETNSRRDGTSMEVVNQLLSPQILSPQIPPQDASNAFGNSLAQEATNNETRPPSPAPSTKSNPRTSSQNPPKRRGRPPATRQSRSRKKKVDEGNTSGYEEGTDGENTQDGPPARKRAKVTQATAAKSSFGSGADSLRVTASTNGSIRSLRPPTIAPAPAPGSHLQDLPRAPTPVPFGSDSLPQNNPRRPSTLSQQAPRRYQSPCSGPPPSTDGAEPIRDSIETAMTPPEQNVAMTPEQNGSPLGDTPPDIGSSPPVLRTASPVMRTASPLPSSPVLQSSPVLPKMPSHDSGFYSGSVRESAEPGLRENDADATMDVDAGTDADAGMDVDSDRPIDEEDIAIAAKQVPRRRAPPKTSRMKPSSKVASRAASEQGGFFMIEEEPGPRDNLPQKLLPRPPHLIIPVGMPRDELPPMPPKPKPEKKPQRKVMPRTMSMTSMTSEGDQNLSQFLPPSEVGDGTSPIQNLPRLDELPEVPAFAGLDDPAAGGVAEAPVADEDLVPNSSTARGKRLMIRKKLEEAIAKGERPPFCNNCGAVQTPTWRTCFYKDCTGDPGFIEYSDNPGRVTALEILTRDSDGKPTVYRLFKKFLAADEDKKAFTRMLMCNPCGIWMSKYKYPRPEKQWNKSLEPAHRRQYKKGTNQPFTSSGFIPTSDAGFNPTSDAGFQSDAPGPAYQDSPQPQSPKAMTQEGEPEVVSNQGQANPAAPSRAQQRASSLRPTKSSADMVDNATGAVLRRAVQSSPVRGPGSAAEPIAIDDDENLGNTRRLLFPSPRKEGEVKILGDVTTNIIQMQAPPALNLTHPKSPTLLNGSDKENTEVPRPRTPSGDDVQLVQFPGDKKAQLCPTTPTQKRTPPANPFKTPTRPTPSHRPITRSVSRSAKSASFTASARKLIAALQRTPSKAKTPGSHRTIRLTPRRSPRNHHNTPSPSATTHANLQNLIETPNSKLMRQLLTSIDAHHFSGNASAGHTNNDDATANHEPFSDFNLDDLSGDGIDNTDLPSLEGVDIDITMTEEFDFEAFHSEMVSGGADFDFSALGLEMEVEHTGGLDLPMASSPPPGRRPAGRRDPMEGYEEACDGDVPLGDEDDLFGEEKEMMQQADGEEAIAEEDLAEQEVAEQYAEERSQERLAQDEADAGTPPPASCYASIAEFLDENDKRPYDTKFKEAQDRREKKDEESVAAWREERAKAHEEQKQ